MAIRLVSRVLPPAVIKGRGNPVMGIMPKVIPTLMMRWKKKMHAPLAGSIPYVSFARMAMRSPPDDQCVENEDHQGAKEAELFRNDGKHEVCVVAGRKWSWLWVPPRIPFCKASSRWQ